jgi:hypothetical protein
MIPLGNAIQGSAMLKAIVVANAIQGSFLIVVVRYFYIEGDYYQISGFYTFFFII